MATYKHLSDLLKICSVLPALAIMPAMAENVPDAATSPDQVSNWSDHQYDMDDNQSREGGIIKISDQQWIEFIMLDPADGNTITLNKTEDNTNDVHGQGAILYNKGKIDRIAGTASNNTIINNSTVANKATANGGAFALYGGTDIGTIDVDFIKNSVQAEYIGGDGTTEYTSKKQISAGGGAIHIQGAFGSTGTAKIDKINGDFIGNSAIGDGYANGGAIYVKAGAGDRDDAGAKGGVTINSINGDFDGNFVIAKTGTTTNAEDSTGGAISIKLDPNASDADATVAVTGDFRNNYVETNLTRALGGAIYNQGNLTVNGDFINNHVSSKAEKSSSGGAIYNTGKLTLGENLEFKGNRADYAGGAIYNIGDMGELNGITFYDNHAFGTHTGAAGGAINNANLDGNSGGTIESIIDSMFANNKAFSGAAIRNQGSIGDIKNTKFHNNEGGNGGAIWNGTWGAIESISGDQENTKIANIKNSEFVENTALFGAAQQGGAITNAGTIDSIAYTLFSGNRAGKKGGAIANVTPQKQDPDAVSKIVFDTVVFENNHAGEAGGAIYNVGTISFDGDNVFRGNTVAGVANDIHNVGTMKVASGTTTLGGGITGEGTLTLASGATLNIGSAKVVQNTIDLDGDIIASIVNANSFGQFVGHVDLSADSELTLDVGAAGEYSIFGNAEIEADKITYNDSVFNLTTDGNKIVVSTKSVDEIMENTNLSTGAANAVSIMANTNDDVLNTISLRAQQDMVAGKTGNAEKELAKLNPDDKPVAQSVASSVQNQVLSLAAGRMSGASVGRSGGDLTSADYGMWVQGLYNHSKYNGKFTGDTMGISVGADTLIDGKYTLGIGYAYNDTDVDSNSRDTAIESHSVFLYGQYKPNEWYVNAALNYTMSNYTESADVYGVKLADAEYDVNSFGGQIMTGYDFVAGNPASIFTPEVGVRYLHVAQDAYQGTLGDVDALDTDYLTGVAGIKYAFEIESDSELKFRPELRAAATYDFMSDAAVATVNAPGNVSYVIDADRLSRFGGEFGIGLAAQYRGLEVSLNYELDLHEDYTSQTGMLKFRYDF
ncbi:MAG: autotransporter domain-containing protein [Proteobacteria bacterium]|uniref:Autotransporter domain-containing protein n=1 Tax=Candidatus Enterousia avistercoris TaxID=2840788 RepID=A0A9D9DDV2_9PROT|nr:autotransporter domain-containing protein [Candidatus Enterousia avistercoris]